MTTEAGAAGAALLAYGLFSNVFQETRTEPMPLKELPEANSKHMHALTFLTKTDIKQTIVNAIVKEFETKFGIILADFKRDDKLDSIDEDENEPVMRSFMEYHEFIYKVLELVQSMTAESNNTVFVERYMRLFRLNKANDLDLDNLTHCAVVEAHIKNIVETIHSECDDGDKSANSILGRFAKYKCTNVADTHELLQLIAKYVPPASQ